MNLYSKIALLIVAGVGIGRAVAEMLGQLVYIWKYIIISQKKEQNKQFKSFRKKLQTPEFSSRFEGRFSNKRTFTKS